MLAYENINCQIEWGMRLFKCCGVNVGKRDIKGQELSILLTYMNCTIVLINQKTKFLEIKLTVLFHFFTNIPVSYFSSNNYLFL